jgi:hypothetical protein
MRKTKCEFIKLDDAVRFHSLMSNNDVDIQMFESLDNDRTMFVAYTDKSHILQPNKRGNPIIASFVAMWGRLELLKELQKLGERVLYFDTDSIVFTAGPGEYRPEIGAKLGEWTDETVEKFGPTVEIVEFVANAPKSYAERYSNGEEMVKIRGFTQTLASRDSVNFASIYNCVMCGLNMCENNASAGDLASIGQQHQQSAAGIAPTHICKRVITSEQPLHFVRNKLRSEIKRVHQVKTTGLNISKRRRIDGTFNTEPYGYDCS